MVENDKDVLQSFTEFVKMKRTKTMQLLIDKYYEGYPHLTSFFNAIEEDPSFLNNPHFHDHISQTIENSHLWN